MFLLPHLPGAPEVPDAEAGDAAAALGRDDHRKAVRLQERHSGLPHVYLVGVREAAVEVGDPRPAGTRGGGQPAAEPLPERGILVGGQVPPPVDCEEPVEKPPDGAVLHQGVDDAGVPGGQLAEAVAPDQEPVPKPPPPFVHEFRLCQEVQLGDGNPGGADGVAEAAGRAEVDPVVHRGLGGRTEPLRPRAGLLRPRKAGGHAGHRADRHAGGAPDADVREGAGGSSGFGLGRHAASAPFAAR